MMRGLGGRMKDNYEDRQRFALIRRMPVVVRLDGKAFHTLTRRCDKPFDMTFGSAMAATATALCSEMQGAKFAYTQSDEISILLTDYDRFTTGAWFDYGIQKIVSVSAGIASAFFTSHYLPDEHMAVFDARAFNLPREEVANYFVWRQQDWVRNSVMMLAQSHFSHKQLHKKSQSDMHEMLHGIGVNWADLDAVWKNGRIVYKTDAGWTIEAAPIFSKSHDVIEACILQSEE